MAKKPLHLDLATFASPVFIAQQHPLGSGSGYSYFYNGHVVYSFYKQSVAIFPQLNPDTLKVKPYGIADANHVVAGAQLYEVKPGKFKRVGKYGHFYFIKNGEVYRPQGKDVQLVAAEGADAKTFAVIDEDIAEDKDHFFFKRNLQGIHKDKLRTLSAAQAYLSEWDTGAQTEKRKSPLIPGDFNASLIENLDRLGRWLNEDFSDKWALQRTNLSLYRLVATYLQWCAEAFQDDGNVVHLELGFALYKRFALYSWLCPEILHQAARLYVYAGQLAEALACCDQALQFRYSKFSQLLADESLRSLHALPEFSMLEKEFAASGDDLNGVSLPLLDACETALDAHANDESFCRWMRQSLLYQFRFYQQSELEARVQSSCGMEQARWQRLAQKNRFYFEHYMLLEGPHEVISPQGKLQWEAFLRYHDYAQLEPLAYLRMADILFCEAHQWASWKYNHFEETRQVLAPRIKEASQLLAYFRELAAGLTAERQSELLESAQGFAMVQIMQASGKQLLP